MIVAENKQTEEKVLKAKSGWGMLILSLLLIVAGILLCVFSSQTESALVIVMVCAGVLVIVVGAIMLGGLKTVNPNELSSRCSENIMARSKRMDSSGLIRSVRLLTPRRV